MKDSSTDGQAQRGDAKRKSSADLPPGLTSMQVGIWRVIFEEEAPDTPSAADATDASAATTKAHTWTWTDVLTHPTAYLPVLLADVKRQVDATHLPRLIKDVYTLGPWLFGVMLLSYALTGVEDALMIFLSNKLLALIEDGIAKGSPDAPAILRAIAYRVVCMALICTWRWFASHCTPVLKARVKLFFQERLLHAHLMQDYPTSREASAGIDQSPLNAWYALQHLLGSLDVLFSTLSQLLLLVNLVLAPRAGAPEPSATDGAATGKGADAGLANTLVVLALCATWPLVNSLLKRDLDGKPYVAHIRDAHYVRAKTLFELATTPLYKRELVSGTLGAYVRAEHARARAALGAVSDDYPSETYALRRTPLASIVLGLLDDLPLIYFAVTTATYTGRGVSIASLAMLHSTLGTVRGTLERVLAERRSFRENLRSVRGMYAGVDEPEPEGEARGGEAETREAEAEAAICDDGTVEDACHASRERTGAGIGIELRDVSFSYPASSETGDAPRQALAHVSFTIPPSSLVVIVGANGSGKSSLVNLLSCLYRPTAGSVLFDGADPWCEDAQQHAVEELQHATAVLTQDHSVFPAFTVWENIAVGDPALCLAHAPSPRSPTSSGDMRLADAHPLLRARVREAARLGGALAFIERLDRGFDAVLRPAWTAFGSTYPLPAGPLRDALDRLEAWHDLSGGEAQRLAAARTFMRLRARRTRLVVVDEPSSAMDPRGEFELFERLRAMRAGKTMVFVTHRFGHLTKYADVILCMKDGQLVEAGTHKELMAMNGEYCQLYGIQAKAFVDVPHVGGSTPEEDTATG